MSLRGWCLTSGCTAVMSDGESVSASLCHLKLERSNCMASTLLRPRMDLNSLATLQCSTASFVLCHLRPRCLLHMQATVSE